MNIAQVQGTYLLAHLSEVSDFEFVQLGFLHDGRKGRVRRVSYDHFDFHVLTARGYRNFFLFQQSSTVFSQSS